MQELSLVVLTPREKDVFVELSLMLLFSLVWRVWRLKEKTSISTDKGGLAGAEESEAGLTYVYIQ
jgi:hypothetical protein